VFDYCTDSTQHARQSVLFVNKLVGMSIAVSRGYSTTVAEGLSENRRESTWKEVAVSSTDFLGEMEDD
jgi:hypothetical protein